MPILKIRLYGDPVLRKKAAPVKDIGGDEKKLFEDMRHVKKSARKAALVFLR